MTFAQEWDDSSSSSEGRSSTPRRGGKASTTLTRAMRILLVFDDDRAGLSVSDISNELGIHKSLVSRTLTELTSMGFTARDPMDGRRYRLGPTIRRLGSRASNSLSLIQVARPHLERLRELTKETVSLQVRSGTSRYCIDQAESMQAIRRVVEINSPLPLYQGSSGLVLLAFTDSATQKRLIDDFQLSQSEKVLLRKRIDITRENGYAVSFSGRVDGVSGVSVAVVGGSASAVAAIAISGPAVRLDQDVMSTFLPELQIAAKAVSLEGGW